MVYVELGRFQLYIIRKLRILKYWLMIRQSHICILQIIFAVRAVNINQELQCLGLGQTSDVKKCAGKAIKHE